MDGDRLRGEVIHVVEVDQQADHDLHDELRELAESRRILVLREGGQPSLVDRLRSFLRREPIEAVTLVTDAAAAEGEEVTATVRETALANVYVAEGSVAVED